MSNSFRELVSQRDAAYVLSTSERTLARLRATGVLPIGRCWQRKNPTNKNSHCLYNIEACIEVLSGQSKAAEMETDLLANSEKKEVIEE
tara:strand:- start:50 stop:316 length:267 start_codon:yes stop_codon:yes gene_type:complete